MFWTLTVRLNCCSDLKTFSNSHRRSEKFRNQNSISEPQNSGDAVNLFRLDRYFNYQAPQKWMQIHENKIGPTNGHNGVKLNLFSHLNILHSFLVCFPSPSYCEQNFWEKISWNCYRHLWNWISGNFKKDLAPIWNGMLDSENKYVVVHISSRPKCCLILAC